MTFEAAKTRGGGATARSRAPLSLAEFPDLPNRPCSGRGIVICAGGAQMFTNAWVLVWLLRKVLGCSLPIEVWHLGPGEMSSGMREMLAGLSVEPVDACAVLSRFPARISDGWQLKPYALMMSRYREVLLMDADNVPAVDPTFLFERSEFLETGAVFWPDAIDIAATNPIWDEFNLPAQQRASFEAGQVLVDKARHGEALKTVLHLNEDSDRYYKLVYGDKDTFLIAWTITQSKYVLVPHRPVVDRHVYYQRDFDGNVIFQHRTNGKWRYGGEQVRSDAFVHEAACEEALAELRRRWNGRVFEPPARTLAARRTERAIEGHLFIAARPGEEDRELEFLPGGQIGRGRDFDRETWYVAEPEPSRFVLRILDRHGVRYEFRLLDGARWAESDNPEVAMSLTPVGVVAERDGAGPRDLAFVRNLINAVLAHGSWTDDVARELRASLSALNKVDPRLLDDVEAFAASDKDLTDETRDHILDLARSLKSTAADPVKRSSRSPADMLFDSNLYVRP